MEFGLTEKTFQVNTNACGHIETVEQVGSTTLWKFMRHDAAGILKSQQSCSERHRTFRREINKQLESGRFYPWCALARLGAEKFYSDLIESIIGAIFVDSEGCLGTCERFLDRIGMTSYLRRLLDDHLEVEHPRSVLDRMLSSGTAEYQVTQTETGLRNVSVRINGEEVAVVSDCISKNEAIVRGADATILFLTSHSDNLVSGGRSVRQDGPMS